MRNKLVSLGHRTRTPNLSSSSSEKWDGASSLRANFLAGHAYAEERTCQSMRSYLSSVLCTRLGAFHVLATRAAGGAQYDGRRHTERSSHHVVRICRGPTLSSDYSCSNVPGPSIYWMMTGEPPAPQVARSKTAGAIRKDHHTMS
jgi:hypothetical protein